MMMTGKLIIVPTPLGNLGDMTARALEALEQADVACAEDTRVTGKLLAHFGIENRLERCDENVIAAKSPALVSRMLDGEEVAFCSDAGMPGISDPGCVLVDAAREAGVPVDVLPGPSAVTTALVTSGFKYNAFYFGGFLPRKEADRAALLESLANLGCRARLLRVAPSRHRISRVHRAGLWRPSGCAVPRAHQAA